MKKYLISLSILSVLLFTCYSCTESHAAKLMPITSLPSMMVPVKHYSVAIKPYLLKLLAVLQDGTADYNWSDGCKCNVGLLAQIISNESYLDLRKEKIAEYPEWLKFMKDNKTTEPGCGSWKTLINLYCGQTKPTMHGIVGEMIKSGFTKEDLIHLEYLSDDYVLSHMKDDNLEQDKETDLIKYLKTWISLI